MEYIKVLATDSTNTELKQRFRQNKRMPNTVLNANHQRKGRGQRQGTWNTSANKNLTFSLLLKNIKLPVDTNFKLSALVSLAVAEQLQQIAPKANISIKWPNDILAGNKKICGILIENMLQKTDIEHSIIGIGLNVNQTDFAGLPQAGSLKTVTHRDYKLEELLVLLAEAVEQKVYNGLQTPLSTIITTYEQHLFRHQLSSTFQFPNGEKRVGKIQGISPSGHLKILFETGLHYFDLKEIKLLY